MRFPLSILFLFFLGHSYAQDRKYLIHFTNKENDGFRLSDPSGFLSPKSILRRTRQQLRIDSTDLPLTEAYVDSLAGIPGLKILNRSKWFNQVLVSVSDTAVLEQIRRFTFLSAPEAVNAHRIKKSGDISVNRVRTAFSGLVAAELKMENGISGYDYGASADQIKIHHGDTLHSLGFHGDAMTIALLDNGFNNYLGNPAFKNARDQHRILGSYDFVHQKASVNEEGIHGSNCFSIIAADLPGILVGSAPQASYWLLKTEDDNSESPAEEQNWVAAAEFADSVGVDLISTSLGYGYFDDPVYDLTYESRNGHRALVTQAANLAVAKGIIVTASMGNSGADGGETKFVGCPADGDQVYAVGAVDRNGRIAGFSSWGPNAAGQVKPDGVSVGAGTSFIGNDGNPYTGGGTSYSNPNLAGLIACLWQAFPGMGPQDILTAVRASSDKFNQPDDRYGYGIPDFAKAYRMLTDKRAALPSASDSSVFVAFPVPFQGMVHLIIQPKINGLANIVVIDVSGRIIQSLQISVRSNQSQSLDLNLTQAISTGIYFIRYTDPQTQKTLKILKY